MEGIASKPNGAHLRAGSSHVKDFIVLMRPDAEQSRRMNPDEDLPKWFGYPIGRSGYQTYFTRSAKEIGGVAAQSGHVRPLALIFNISLREFLLLPLLRSRCRVVSLFQWRALETLPALKRLVYRTILASSEYILVYSRIHEDYVRLRFPRAKVRWMGLYTDTDYFQTQQRIESPQCPEPFLLVPGNHKRDENLVFEVAETLRMPVVRFSSSPAVAREYATRRSPRVTFLANLSFKRIRCLYQQAAAVLNIADDSEWPVGITTFCEALAMNARIITPSGHSASGYQFEDGMKPYLNVKNPGSAPEWCETTRRLLKTRTDSPPNRTPRSLALKLCSLEAAATTWNSLSAAPEII